MPMLQNLADHAPRDQVKIAPTLLQFDGVSQTYMSRDGELVPAVQSVSCAVQSGEFISVLGPSGCGKTTLMMMASGLLKPTTGRVIYDGRELTETGSDFGIVFQTPVLFPWRTVQKNVELPGEVRGVSARERSDRARELLELVGLKDFGQRMPYELSGGMQQRASIARALALEPSLLLMDEPFGALDAMTREQMNLELQRLSIQLKTTIVFITHSIAEAAFLSDRIIVMSQRPSRVLDIVKIDIPRPRDIDLMASDEFGAYVNDLRRLLDRSGEPS
jgi:NitT/TauT family transport system ATP-binding protein